MRFISAVLSISLAFSNALASDNNETIKASAHPSRLRHGPGIGDVAFSCKENTASHCTLADIMKDARVCALLVIKSGVVRLERFSDDNALCKEDDRDHSRNDDGRRYTVASVTKSISSTLLGSAIAEKFNARTKPEIAAILKKPVGYFIPSLAQRPRSAYADVTLGDVLRMRSGVRWSEGGWYGLFSDNDRLMRNDRRSPRLGVVEFAKGYRTRVTGKTLPFNYSALDAAIVAATTDRILDDETLTNFAAKRLWTAIGAATDARWGTDKTGLALGNCCFKASVGDLGRFGMLVLNKGRSADGRQVLPEAWIDLATRRQNGSDDAIPEKSPSQNTGCPMDYRYFWWLRQGRSDFTAVGVNGQFIHVYPGFGANSCSTSRNTVTASMGSRLGR